MKRTGTVLLGFLMMLSQSILSRAQQSDELREEFHQSYPLLQSGRLSLENINGFVRIEGWDRNEVKVDAVKHAYTAERLAEAKIEVENDAEGVRIRTTYP